MPSALQSGNASAMLAGNARAFGHRKSSTARIGSSCRDTSATIQHLLQSTSRHLQSTSRRRRSTSRRRPSTILPSIIRPSTIHRTTRVIADARLRRSDASVQRVAIRARSATSVSDARASLHHKTRSVSVNSTNVSRQANAGRKSHWPVYRNHRFDAGGHRMSLKGKRG